MQEWKYGMVVTQVLQSGVLRSVKLISFDSEAGTWTGIVRSGPMIGNTTCIRQLSDTHGASA